MKKDKSINYLVFVLLTHLSALIAFAIIRGIQLSYCSLSIKDSTKFSEILECFVRGAVYDNHCSLIALIPVTLVLGIQSIIGKENKIASKIGLWITTILYFIELAVCCGNIVYVKYQFSNMTLENVKSLGMGTEVLDMITTGPYLIAFLLSLIFCVGFCFLVFFLYKKFVKENMQNRIINIVIFVVLGLLMFAGIRGKISYKEKHIRPYQKVFGKPLDTSFAEYSNQLILNISAMNDIFFLEKCTEQAAKGNDVFNYMPDKEADKIAFRYHNYPHEADANSIKKKDHIFLVLMEGMSAKVMKTFGYPKTITPFLDSIYYKSLSYSDFYSAGVITQKGMCATFSSCPTFVHFHSMKNIPKSRSVVSTVFKSLGYTTQMFIPHGPNFDNVYGFFAAHPFEYRYCLDDYPREYIFHGWGATDEYLYNFAINKTDSLIKNGVEKTFSVVYGCSNHPPYSIPKEYYLKGFSEEEAAIYYADAQLGMLYNKVRSTEWGKNALFIFVADHGRNYVHNLLASCHIPLIINHPEVEPRVDNTLGVQYDVIPTTLSLIGAEYKDYVGYGIDLARSKRDTVFFAHGDKYCLRTKGKVYLYSPDSDHSEIWCDAEGSDFEGCGSEDAKFKKLMKAHLQAGVKFATTK